MDTRIMEMKTIELRKLTADEGMTLYDGETLGKEIYLGTLDSPERWHEITDAEAEAIRAEQEAAAMAEAEQEA